MNNLLKKIILKKDTKNILKTKKCATWNRHDIASLSAYLPYLQQFHLLFNSSVSSTLQNIQCIFKQYQSQIQSFLCSLANP